MTNTTNSSRALDSELRTACEELLRESNLRRCGYIRTPVIEVRLPDGTTGLAYPHAILASAEDDRQDVVVAQGNRMDYWFPSQLRLA